MKLYLPHPSKIFAVVLLLGSWASALHAEGLKGKITGITAPDSIAMTCEDNREHSLRLLGVLLPRKGQPKQPTALLTLKTLIVGKKVSIEWFPLPKACKAGEECPKFARITLGGRDVGLIMLSRGLAWYDRRYAGELSATDRMLYNEAEEDAKKHRRGVWSAANPTPPWEFREPQSIPEEKAKPKKKSKGARAALDMGLGPLDSHIPETDPLEDETPDGQPLPEVVPAPKKS